MGEIYQFYRQLHLSSSQALRLLSEFSRYRDIVIPLDYKEAMKRISDIDISKYSDKDAKEIGKLFNLFDNSNSGAKVGNDLSACQGALLELLEISRRGATRLQDPVNIFNSEGKKIGKRLSDFYDNGTFYDAKAYTDVSKISGAMNANIKTSSGEKPGQAFLDFVHLGLNPSEKKAYVFGATATGKETEIWKSLETAAKKSKNKEELIKHWGLEGDNVDKLFLTKLKEVKKQFSIEVATF